MDIIEEYYGKQPFILYSLFGKVPGKKAWPRRIFLTISVLILMWATFTQLLRVIKNKFKRQVIIELLPTIMATAGTLAYIPYVTLATAEQYSVLLSMMVDDLKEERTKEEDAIKRRYANEARMFTNAFTFIFGVAMCGMPLSGFIPCLLNILVPINETREKKLFVYAEFLVDEKDHFYWVYGLECCTVLVTCILIGASENMSVVIGQHICSMFAVLGFMLLIAEFSDFPLTLIISATFCALTVSLVQITDPELINFTIMAFTVTQVLQLFILSHMGQCGIDISEKIAKDAYSADWHVCSPNERRLLQLVILRSSKPCVVVASNMYTLCMENFMSVMQTATSCYMVLRQTQ